MLKKVVMPAAGQTTDVATVTKLKVIVGDAVKKGDVLLEVETDKAVLPIESFAKGFVTEIYVNEFDKVDAGTPLLAIGDKDDLEAAKNAPSAPIPTLDEDDDFTPVIKTSAPVEVKPAPAPAAVTAPVDSTVKAMPNAKKLAAELGVALENVKPSNGQFIKAEDVRAAAPAAEAAEAAPAATIPTARIRKTLARRWDESVAVPTFSVGITVKAPALDALIEANGEITRAHFVMLALARLSTRYPLLRVRFEKGEQLISETADAGLAVFAENGTVSSVVENADRLGLAGIASACKANLTAIGKGDLSSVGGAAFTVFDASSYNVDSFAAPINAPEIAAFGVAGNGDSFSVTGSFDIRVFEGNVGASIMADLRERLENPALLLL